jgi:hypothetical protein
MYFCLSPVSANSEESYGPKMICSNTSIMICEKFLLKKIHIERDLYTIHFKALWKIPQY